MDEPVASVEAPAGKPPARDAYWKRSTSDCYHQLSAELPFASDGQLLPGAAPILEALVERMAGPDFGRRATRVRVAPGPNRTTTLKEAITARGIDVVNAIADASLSNGRVVVEVMWDPLCAGSLI